MRSLKLIPLFFCGLSLCLVGCAGWTGKNTPAVPKERIKAFCIDFNWGAGGFATPGLYAKASAKEHYAWYRDLGVNTIQTFCVSTDGYAWYRSKIAPVQPGMQGDFLKEMVKLGHRDGLKVMGYFCVGANTVWGQQHPELSYGTPAFIHIPLTNQYLDYLCSLITESVKTTGIDGFMIDWMWSPVNWGKPEPKMRWMDCEQQMFVELMGRPFPGKDKVDEATEHEFHRRAINRCWARIHDAAHAAKSDCVIWLSCSLLADYQVADSPMLQEIDWVMNESPDLNAIANTRGKVNPKGLLIQNLCGWGDQHDARKLIEHFAKEDVGFYGFAAPDPQTTLPPENPALGGNATNIDIIRQFYHQEGH